jgi:hypothetical protein
MQYLIGRQRLEEINRLLEEVDDFFGGFVIGVAFWF